MAKRYFGIRDLGATGDLFKSGKVATKIFDRRDIEILLKHYKLSATNLVELCKDVYWDVAKFIAEEAFDRAPVDTHTMERAIYVRPVEGRGSYSVYFGFDWAMPYPKSKYKDGRTVGDVFKFIHEGIRPASGATKGLALKSQAKQSTVDVTVGGEFMTRAITENESEIEQRLKEAIHRGLLQMGAQKKTKIKGKRGKFYRVGVDDGF